MSSLATVHADALNSPESLMDLSRAFLVHPGFEDVSSPGEASRIVSEAVRALGELAGIAVTTGTSLSAHCDLERVSDAIWLDAFDDVLMGTVRTVRAAVPHLIAAGGGTSHD